MKTKIDYRDNNHAQLELGIGFKYIKEEPKFNGPEYDPERDYTRLKNQIGRVFKIMKDRKWRTLNNISEATSLHTSHGNPDPEASVSAQLRHLRKKRFGSHTINRKHILNGLFEYQLIPNE